MENIDQKFKQALHDMEITPPQHLWEEISTRSGQGKEGHRKLFWVAAAVALIFTLGGIFWRTPEPETLVVLPKKPIQLAPKSLEAPTLHLVAVELPNLAPMQTNKVATHKKATPISEKEENQEPVLLAMATPEEMASENPKIQFEIKVHPKDLESEPQEAPVEDEKLGEKLEHYAQAQWKNILDGKPLEKPKSHGIKLPEIPKNIGQLFSKHTEN